jgi:hypothetical protein
MVRIHRVLRSAVPGLLAMALVAVLVAPAAAATPTREVIDLDDPAAEAFWSEVLTDACGFEVAVDFEGTVTVHVFTDRRGDFRMEIDKYWIRDRFTNVETGATVLLKDVGPDQVRVRNDGQVTLAIVGRSLTGSGVIGRVLYDLDTGELLQMSGREVGPIEDQVCPAID